MEKFSNVLMLHSVGSNKTGWKENYLSLDSLQFEKFCRWLSHNNFQTHFLNRWCRVQDGLEVDGKKDLYLTFDDGYLDNLLIAYPIMKKYGIRGTIFINPEFVDPSLGIRTMHNTQSTLGFLNWDEIKFLDKSDIFDIQSHSMSHNYYFCSNKLVGVHKGDNLYHFLAWISNPSRKAFWQFENQGNFTPAGTPVFEYGRALGLRRYIPDDELIKKAIEAYSTGVDDENYKILVEDLLLTYPGRYESDEEMRQRYWYEIHKSKQILEEQLDKKIDFMCWPGGGYNQLAVQLSEEAGYLASTISSRDVLRDTDNKGIEYKRIPRTPLSSTVVFGRYFRKKRRAFSHFPDHLIWKFQTSRGKNPYYILTRINNFFMRFF